MRDRLSWPTRFSRRPGSRRYSVLKFNRGRDISHLTLKTDIAFALAEHPRIIGHRKHRWHIPLVSSEWETLSDTPPTKAAPGRSMIHFAPHEEPWAMEAYHAWVRIFELHRDYYWIVDRFHISTRSYQLQHAKRDFQFEWLEERLEVLNFHMVQCVRRPETFAAARTARLAYSENPTRYNDLQKFVAEQDLMRRLVGESRLRTLEVDVSDNDVDRAATIILDWVESTGGFWRLK
jgi:hypothetical protein